MRPPPQPGEAARVLDVGGLAVPDLATVSALARLQLHARRRGETLRLRGASPGLCEAIELAGLADVLPTTPGGEAGRRGGRAGPCPGRT